MESIIVDSKNLHSLVNYVEKLKVLNRYIKDNFNKRERAELCVSPIIDDMHKEIETLEKSINKYLQADAKDFIHKDMYLKGFLSNSIMPSMWEGDVIYIKIKANPQKKRVPVDYVIFKGIDRKDGYGKQNVFCEVNPHLYDSKGNPETELLIQPLVYAILDGKISEITQEEYENALFTFKDMKDVEDAFILYRNKTE